MVAYLTNLGSLKLKNYYLCKFINYNPNLKIKKKT